MSELLTCPCGARISSATYDTSRGIHGLGKFEAPLTLVCVAGDTIELWVSRELGIDAVLEHSRASDGQLRTPKPEADLKP